MNIFNIYFSNYSIDHNSIRTIIKDVQKSFSANVEYFERVAGLGEFDEFGGPRGAVIHNLKLALSRCQQESNDNKIRQRLVKKEKIRQHLTETIPELA